jgi:biotin transport system substrate-specific component
MSVIRSTRPAEGRLEFLASPLVRRAAGVIAFAVLTALSARIALPVPGTPVPFTFQPLLVLLAGGLLGARMGAASQLLYLTLGAVGFPVFAAGGGVLYLLGPTGGYLLAYPVAAFVVGSLAGGGVARQLAGLLAGVAVIYAGGASWLAIVAGSGAALALGIYPFLLADLVKALLALVVVRRLRSRALELFAS